jgi:hypothetical protein
MAHDPVKEARETTARTQRAVASSRELIRQAGAARKRQNQARARCEQSQIDAESACSADAFPRPEKAADYVKAKARKLSSPGHVR